MGMEKYHLCSIADFEHKGQVYGARNRHSDLIGLRRGVTAFLKEVLDETSPASRQEKNLTENNYNTLH